MHTLHSIQEEGTSMYYDEDGNVKFIVRYDLQGLQERPASQSCPAKDAECNFCGLNGHFAKCCGKAGKFPKDSHKNSTQKENSNDKKPMHALQCVQEESASMYYDEDGNVKMYSKSGV